MQLTELTHTTIDIDVECARCGGALEAKELSARVDHRVGVEPCPRCLDEAIAAAVEAAS